MEQLYNSTFIGDSSKYYIEKIEQFDNGKKVTFNIPSFFFGILWFLRRKMYKQALIIFGGMFTLTIIEQYFLNSYYTTHRDLATFIQISTTFIVALFTGFSGNWFYILHIKKNVSEITNLYSYDEDVILEKLRKKGGTSHIGVIIALIILLFFLALPKLVK